MTSQVEKIQGICNKASDEAVQKGDAQAKAWLARQFESHKDELVSGSSTTGHRGKVSFDTEIDGIWYTLHKSTERHMGRVSEVYGFHRNWKLSPKNAADEAKESEGAAKRVAMFGR